MVSRASICSEMRMIPISAAMAEPARPMTMIAASTGPSSLINVKATAAPSNPSDPNLESV